MLFLPCRAAVVVQDPDLRSRDHPPPPDLDRVAVAEAEPRPAGPAGPGLPAQRRDVRRARRRVRGRDRHGLAVRERDRRPARGPRAEAAQGGPGREEGRVRLRGPGRHADPDRPGRRGPAVLLRQAQEARDEPAGHRQPRTATSCGCPGRCPARCTTRRPSGSGASWTSWRPRAWSPWPTRATRAARYAKIPYKGKNKPESQKEANRAHAKLRSPGERANAQLKTWRILRKLRCCPWRAGQLAKAIHVLQVREA